MADRAARRRKYRKRPRPQPLLPLHHCPAQRALDLHSAGRNKKRTRPQRLYPARRRPENQTRLCPDRHSRHPRRRRPAARLSRHDGHSVFVLRIRILGADVRQSGLQTGCRRQRYPPGQRDSAEQNFGNRPRSHHRGIGLAAVCQTECERQQFRCHQGQETK